MGTTTLLSSPVTYDTANDTLVHETRAAYTLNEGNRFLFSDRVDKNSGQDRDYIISIPSGTYVRMNIQVKALGNTFIDVYKDVSTTNDGTGISDQAYCANTEVNSSTSVTFSHTPTDPSGTQTVQGLATSGCPFFLSSVDDDYGMIFGAGKKVRVVVTSQADSNYVNLICTWEEYGSEMEGSSSSSSSSTASSSSSSTASSSTASSSTASSASSSTASSASSQSSASSSTVSSTSTSASSASSSTASSASSSTASSESSSS